MPTIAAALQFFNKRQNIPMLAREPGISAEVLGLRDGLLKALGGSRASENEPQEGTDGQQ